MSEYRQLHRSFWESDYVQEELDSDGRLIYNYLITCPKSNMEGLYRCSLKRLTDETTHDRDRTRAVLAQLEADRYAGWMTGWVCVVQAPRHFPVKNTTVMSHARKLYSEVPEPVLAWAMGLGYAPVCPIDSLSIGYRTRLDNTRLDETHEHSLSIGYRQASDRLSDLREAVDLAPSGGVGPDKPTDEFDDYEPAKAEGETT